jgi:NAD(P)-dependent dehydrogenase (short-subunit alcohol dehydrogenase family)
VKIGETLDRRSFSMLDQQLFGQLSGDVNPLHLDLVSARRTAAGKPAVHGIHLLLWALEEFCKHTPVQIDPKTLVVRFLRFVRIGEDVTVVVKENDELGCQLAMVCNAVVVGLVSLGYGAPAVRPAITISGKVWRPTSALSHSSDEVGNISGRVEFAVEPVRYAEIFPYAATYFGEERLAAFGCLTFIVGMVVPGENSIFSKLSIGFDQDDEMAGLSFAVRDFDKRLSLINTSVAGSGIFGTIESVIRPLPAVQPSVKDLLMFVNPAEFKNARALVIGGSRGIGELTAKLLAVGGGHPTISYALGKTDALRVQAEIHASGLKCDVTHIDVLDLEAVNIQFVGTAYASMYYFATPSIFGGGASLELSTTKHNFFQSYYVDGFYNVARALARQTQKSVSLFYPSSTALDEISKGMMEYAMAKAAGEVLSQFLNKHEKNLRVLSFRLPKLATDQTNSLLGSNGQTAREVMLPLIREVEKSS